MFNSRRGPIYFCTFSLLVMRRERFGENGRRKKEVREGEGVSRGWKEEVE